MTTRSACQVAVVALLFLWGGMTWGEQDTEPAPAPEPGPSAAPAPTDEPAAAAAPEAAPAAIAESVPEPAEAMPVAADIAEPEAEQAAVETPTAAMASRLEAAVVEYRTAWSTGRGFLVGDRRTVVVPAYIPNTGRRITVRTVGPAEPDGSETLEANVVLVRSPERGEEHIPFAVLHLDRDLPADPLVAVETPPVLGERVYVLLAARREQGRIEVETAETTVTAISESTMSLGTAAGQVGSGAPVLDASGRIAGFFVPRGYAMHIGAILEEQRLRPRGFPIVPVVGVRLGTEFGGPLEQPFVMDFDIGLALWDQLGIGVRLGFGVGTEDFYRIPENALHQAGVAQARHTSFDLGLEVEYRLMLTRTPLTFYVDFAVGVQYILSVVNPFGPAFYATVPNCDPFGEACEVTLGEVPGREIEHGVGASFGGDVRVGALTVGYRFVPEALSYNLGNVHRVTFGVTAF